MSIILIGTLSQKPCLRCDFSKNQSTCNKYPKTRTIKAPGSANHTQRKKNFKFQTHVMQPILQVMMLIQNMSEHVAHFKGILLRFVQLFNGLFNQLNVNRHVRHGPKTEVSKQCEISQHCPPLIVLSSIVSSIKNWKRKPNLNSEGRD